MTASPGKAFLPVAIENREETLTDEECANARRAAAAIALEAERARAPAARAGVRSQVARAARARGASGGGRAGCAAAARAAAEAAYEARWRDPAGPRTAGASPALRRPSERRRYRHAVDVELASFDVYAEDTDPLGRPTLRGRRGRAAVERARHRVAAARDDGSRRHSAPVPRRRRRNNNPRLARPHSNGNVTASSSLGEAGLLFGATTDGAPGSTAAVRSASRNGRAVAGVSNVWAPSGTPLVLR